MLDDMQITCAEYGLKKSNDPSLCHYAVKKLIHWVNMPNRDGYIWHTYGVG